MRRRDQIKLRSVRPKQKAILRTSRLLWVNICRGTGDLPVPQRRDQGPIIDNPRPRHINDDSVWPHRRELRVRDQIDRVGGLRYAQDEDSRLPNHGIERRAALGCLFRRLSLPPRD